MEIPKHGFIVLGITVALAAGFAVGGFLNRSQSSTTKKLTYTYPEPVTSQETKSKTTDPEAVIASLPILRREESLAKINAWINSPHALAQQFELYDAVGRSKIVDFPSIDTVLLERDDAYSNEARATLIVRWIYDDPASLLRHRYSAENAWRGSAYYNLDTLISNLVSKSVSQTQALLSELEATGANLNYEYRVLYLALQKLPPTEDVKEAMLFAIDGASRVGLSLEQPNPVPAATIADVRAALRPEALAAAPHEARNLFLQLAQSDIDSAIELTFEVEDPNLYSQFLNIALPLYAKSEPQNAVWMVFELFDPKNRATSHAFVNALATAVETDPSTVNALYRSGKAEAETNARLFELLQLGGGYRPGLLPLIARLPDSQFRTQNLNSSLSTLARQNIQQAENWITDNLSGEEAEHFRLSIIGMSFTHDPVAALDLFENAPSSQQKSEAARQLAFQWGNENLQEAIDWATDHSDPNVRKTALQALAARWVESDPEAALAFIERESDADIRRTIQDTISQNILNYRSPSAAIEYLDSLPKDTNTDSFYHQAFNLIAVEDPLAALRAAQDRGPKNRSTNFAYQDIARRWLRLDPEDASRSLLAAGGDIAFSSLNAIAETYRQYDPVALEGLANSITDPELKKAFENTIKQGRQSPDPTLIP